MFEYSSQPPGWCKRWCCLCFCFSHQKYFFAGVKIKAFPMKSIKMSWTWLPGTGNRKIFSRVNPLGELMEAGAQWIKHRDRLEFAKTNTWTFPDPVLASHGTRSHQGILPVLGVGGRSTGLVLLVRCDPLSSHRRTAEGKSPVSWSLAFAFVVV